MVAGHEEDLHLAHRALSDEASAEKIVRRVLPRIDWQVMCVVGRDQESEDLVQQCLTTVLESLGTYRGNGSLEGWAGGLSYRVIMRHMKKRRRTERTFTPMREDRSDGAGSVPDPLEDSHEGRVAASLTEHLSKLSMKKRMALVLHVVYDHSVKEVAEISGAPVNTIRDRLRAALRELRASITGDPEAVELLQGGHHASR